MSNTKQSETRRKNKARKAGAKRKKELERKGTTPVFPIHLDGKS